VPFTETIEKIGMLFSAKETIHLITEFLGQIKNEMRLILRGPLRALFEQWAKIQIAGTKVAKS